MDSPLQNNIASLAMTTKLKFGKSLSVVSPPGQIHEGLYHLLLYLYVSGSQVYYLLPLSVVQKHEQRELQRRLRKCSHFPMCYYSESSALAVLRNFLKRLPQPLLEKENWDSLCLKFFSEETLTIHSVASMAREIQTVQTQMSSQENLFFYHLVIVLRETAKDRKRQKIQFNRLVLLLDYLGPVILRPRRRRMCCKSNSKLLSGLDKVFLTFLICFADEIFSVESANLFPPLKTFNIPNTYERIHKHYGSTQ